VNENFKKRDHSEDLGVDGKIILEWMGSGAQPASYTVGTTGSFPVDKAAGA